MITNFDSQVFGYGRKWNIVIKVCQILRNLYIHSVNNITTFFDDCNNKMSVKEIKGEEKQNKELEINVIQNLQTRAQIDKWYAIRTNN